MIKIPALNHEFAVLMVIDVRLKIPNHFCPSERNREGSFLYIYYLPNPFIHQSILSTYFIILSCCRTRWSIRLCWSWILRSISCRLNKNNRLIIDMKSLIFILDLLISAFFPPNQNYNRMRNFSNPLNLWIIFSNIHTKQRYWVTNHRNVLVLHSGFQKNLDFEHILNI